jgi:hypothetical protein
MAQSGSSSRNREPDAANPPDKQGMLSRAA